MMEGLSTTLFATLALLASLRDVFLAEGYISPACYRRTFTNKHPSQRKLPSIQSSTKEDISSAAFDQTIKSSYEYAVESPNVTLTDTSTFVRQNGDNSADSPYLSTRNVFAVIVGVVALLALSQLPQLTTLTTAIITTYSKLLAAHPLPTKSLTAGALCGVSDLIAQYREPNRKEFNFRRWIRFAGKGCVGGLLWSFWYDELDLFLDQENEFNIFKLLGIVTDQWIKPYLGAVKTVLSILMEQFVWCPLVFGFFEIPVSTLLNGGDMLSAKKEVDAKLGTLLISNAKIWTFANIVIYGPVPVDWRPFCSNCVDIGWQSFVSSVAADCGKVEDDVCIVVESLDSTVLVSNMTPSIIVADDGSIKTDEDKDMAFYAEKSRF